MIYILLIVGFVLLTYSANWLVDGSAGLAKRLNVSNLVIGLTVVAFGTSAPELVVNLISSINGTNEIALTNIIGSNIINTLVILGIVAVIYPVACKKSTFRYEIPMSCLAALLMLLMGTDFFGLVKGGFYGVSRTDGIILLIIFCCFLFYSFMMSKRNRERELPEDYTPMKIWKAVGLIIVGLAGLILGGHLIVTNAVTIATNWGVPESIIGLTIVSLGTSLPELATSCVAATKRNTDLAIGNVIGSNIFNVFLVLGVSSVITPLTAYPNLAVDASVALASSLLLLGFLALSKKRTIGKAEGIIMLVLYGCYLTWHLINL